MLGNHFYHSTIRDITVGIGSLFNKLYVRRTDAFNNFVKDIKVPIAYSARETWFVGKKEENDWGTIELEIVLPRMSYILTNIEYDSSRQTGQMRKFTANSTTGNMNRHSMFNPVPYNFTFNLQIYTIYIDDTYQIIEQILPYFAPFYNIQINTVPLMGVVSDLPVFLVGSPSTDDNYQDGFEKNRFITTTLSFRVVGYMYHPVADSKIIKKAFENIYNEPSLTNKLIQIGVEVDPLYANKTDVYRIKETKLEF